MKRMANGKSPSPFTGRVEGFRRYIIRPDFLCPANDTGMAGTEAVSIGPPVKGDLKSDLMFTSVIMR